MLLIIISIIIVLLIVAIYAIYGKNTQNNVIVDTPTYIPSLPPQNIPAPIPQPVSTPVYIPPGIPTPIPSAPSPVPVPIEKPTPTCNGVLADEIAYYYYYNPTVKTDAKSHWDLVGYKDPSVKSCWLIPTPAPIIAFSDISTPVVLPPPPTPIPEPIPTPVIIPEPAPTVVAPTCDGDKRAYYSYYNPDVTIDPFLHWSTIGYLQPGRRSCWPAPNSVTPLPLNNVCDGLLDHEASYYYNLYPDLWKTAYSLPTQDQRNAFAKNHFNTTGYNLGYKSCWAPPVYFTSTLNGGICEKDWSKYNAVQMPLNTLGTIKIVSAKYGRYTTDACGATGPTCAGIDVTAKMGTLCNGKRSCKFPSAPNVYFGTDPCLNQTKQILLKYQFI